jgi:hypothetical protein
MVTDWVSVYAPAVTRPLRKNVSGPEAVAFDELPLLGRRCGAGRSSRQPGCVRRLRPREHDPVTGHPLQPRHGKAAATWSLWTPPQVLTLRKPPAAPSPGVSIRVSRQVAHSWMHGVCSGGHRGP